MSKLRKALVVGSMAAVAAVPFGFSGVAGAQDAGDCGEGGVAASGEQQNAGGLIGSLDPVVVQVVAPIEAPIPRPTQQSCNTNINEVNPVRRP